jgi:hypothetical protein
MTWNKPATLFYYSQLRRNYLAQGVNILDLFYFSI